jgi:apolipoprotein N-acyltransferase
VQPNIDPYHEKFNGTGDEQLARMLQLASTVIDRNTQFVVFPETALAEGIWEEELPSHPQISTLKKFVQSFPHITIVMGASTFKAYHEGDKLSTTARKNTGNLRMQGVIAYDAYNTALMIDTSRIQIYHKSRLVPGVEKMPYPKIFGFLENYAISLGGTSGSLGVEENRRVFLPANGIPIAPAICYESIYGDFMSLYMKQDAQLIFVITNDGWWGDTPGYRQHKHYARLLAISFRKGIARSANTGISCFINQRGDILQQTEWWKEDARSEVLLKNSKKTFYARHGDYIGKFAAFASALMFLLLIIRKFKR